MPKGKSYSKPMKASDKKPARGSLEDLRSRIKNARKAAEGSPAGQAAKKARKK